MFKKVVLGISGGVDSAVAALLLKRKGYDVHGLFMKNWDVADETGHCSADADFKDASVACDILNIPLHHVNFVKEYWNEVFVYLLKEYESGYTPNPDILCNKNIKFNHFYNYATEHLGADAIATGHYANTSFGTYLEHYNPNEKVRLMLAEDRKKDQIFFLCQVKQDALRKTMFPLGNLTKSEVKRIAVENGLEKFAKKRESMGICFIGSRNFQDFIREYIQDKPGQFVDIENGKVVGEHSGLHQWTLGQRTKLAGLPEAYFTAKKDVQNNIIYVVQGSYHPALYTDLFFTSQPHWIHSNPNELKNGNVLNCSFKFQHTEAWEECKVVETEVGLAVNLAQPKRAITEGQYAVFSKRNECLGSAQIVVAGPSEFTLNYSKYRRKRNNVLNIKLENAANT